MAYGQPAHTLLIVAVCIIPGSVPQGVEVCLYDTCMRFSKALMRAPLRYSMQYLWTTRA